MKTSFQVYTYFGRVLATFTTPMNETHHSALENARKYLLKKEKDGVKCWIKFV